MICFTTFLFLTACEDTNMNTIEKQNVIKSNLNIENINEFSRKNIFFGHQSVGMNILDGFKIINSNIGGNVKIYKADEFDGSKESGIYHSFIGDNNKPLQKISDFSDNLRKIFKGKANIAMMKFCYLDIDKNSDLDEVFKAYVTELASLKKEFPEVTFVHITVPLTVSEFSFRNLVKGILGIPDNNINRNIFNSMLVEHYKDKEPVFDLARYESTLLDGNRSKFKAGNNEYFSLAKIYAADNGHLNDFGKELIATKLIEFINEIQIN